MTGKLLLVLYPLLLLSYLSYAGSSQTEPKASSSLCVHNLSTRLNYTTIQEAIDAQETVDRDRILVDNGTYYENIIVTKAVSLIGESQETTIVDGRGLTSVVELSSNNVTITGFTLRNSRLGWAQSGIMLGNVGNCNVSGNDIVNNYYGMWLESSQDNIISGNDFTNNGYGIGLYSSSNRNSILENNVTASGHAGILLASSMKNDVSRNNVTDDEFSIELISSSNNTIIENDITNNSHGIAIYEASNYNDIIGNNFERNGWGLEMRTSVGNRIYHNNFINNTPQVFFYEPGYADVWDNGYPNGGNYWSDHNGTDLRLGPDQNETGNDGIGDAPCSLNTDNEDHYPLMGVFSDLNATPKYDVQTICNSTVSDFQFNSTAIGLNISGEKGTTGFCRICIPTAMMNGTYHVSVNGTEILYILLSCSNVDYSYLYFTYTHSTTGVIIVPEYPSFLVLPIFIIAALLAVISCKKTRLGQRKRWKCSPPKTRMQR